MIFDGKGKNLINRAVNIGGLKQYGVRTDISSLDVSFLISNIYGVFMADNSFTFAYDYEEGFDNRLISCYNYAPITLDSSVSWYSRGNFRTVDGVLAKALNIREIVSDKVLVGEVAIKASDLILLEKDINLFIKNRPNYVNQMLEKKKPVNIRLKLLNKNNRR